MTLWKPSRRLFLAGAGVIAAPAIVRAQSPQIRQLLLRNNPAAASVAAYSGPGDVVSGASIWYGLRAYNAAYATGSNPAIDVTDQAGANAATFNILSNGTLDVASIATWVAAHSVSTIKVTQLYDQSGNANHGTPTGTTPTLVLGPVTGLAANRPALVFGGAGYYTCTSSPNIVQPYTLGTVAVRTGGSGDLGILGGTLSNIYMRFVNPNLARVYDGGGNLADQAQTDGTWHSLHGTFAGVASVMNVDGSSGTANDTGNQDFNVSRRLLVGWDQNTFLTGNMGEVGVWPAGLTGTQMTNLYSNQHTYWGY